MILPLIINTNSAIASTVPPPTLPHIYLLVPLLGILLVLLLIQKRQQLKLRKLQERTDGLEELVQTRTRELQDTQHQLLQSQKLESIGQLAGGMAHDFNNQLAIMQGYLDIVLEEIRAPDNARERLQHIYRAIERSSDLTQQLLHYIHKDSIEKMPVNLNQGLADLGKILRRLLGEHIEVDLDLDNNLWTISANQGNLDQLLTNLSINARDAMPRGGRIDIRTRNVVLDETTCQQHPLAQPGNYITLSISDTGMGIDQEIEEFIFEPFFTTKEQGEGTGLGLAVVNSIVQAHDGWITIQSEPNTGTEFKIFFPATLEPHANEPIDNETTTFKTGMGEHILLIEDDTELNEMLQQTLTSHGYQTSSFETLQEAQINFDAHQTSIDLILSDLILPDGRSIDFIFQSLKKCPDLGIVIITGYLDDGPDLEIIEQQGWPLLHKPMSMSELLEQIDQVLRKPV
ncbi:MAG: response regulator [Candidatus Latescibacteria bacterium]|nr:response regulator [Candidatus Latescibacterota bacterium]